MRSKIQFPNYKAFGDVDLISFTFDRCIGLEILAVVDVLVQVVNAFRRQKVVVNIDGAGGVAKARIIKHVSPLPGHLQIGGVPVSEVAVFLELEGVVSLLILVLAVRCCIWLLQTKLLEGINGGAL